MIVLITANPYLMSAITADIKLRSLDYVKIDLKMVDTFSYESIDIDVNDDDEYYLIGSPEFNNYSRIKLFSELIACGIKPKVFIHSSSMVSESSKLNLGSCIYSNVIIDDGVSIGFNTLIGPNTIIHKNVKIGNNCFIGPNCIIEAGVTVESNSYIEKNCTLQEGIKIGKDVTIKDPGVYGESMISGKIIDKSIGDFVQILK